YIQITELFNKYSTGIKTHRDDFVIDFDESNLKSRIKTFAKSKKSDEFLKETFQLTETNAWNISDAREELKDEDLGDFFKPILYRPFDERFIFYHSAVVDRERQEIMRHLFHENICLITSRQAQSGFQHALVSNKISEHN